MDRCGNCNGPSDGLATVTGGPHPVLLGTCCLWMHVGSPGPTDILQQILAVANTPEDPLTRVLKIRDIARSGVEALKEAK
jgi:hypothetical protein